MFKITLHGGETHYATMIQEDGERFIKFTEDNEEYTCSKRDIKSLKIQ